jgi:hypothetical protein
VWKESCDYLAFRILHSTRGNDINSQGGGSLPGTSIIIKEGPWTGKVEEVMIRLRTIFFPAIVRESTLEDC